MRRSRRDAAHFWARHCVRAPSLFLVIVVNVVSVSSIRDADEYPDTATDLATLLAPLSEAHLSRKAAGHAAKVEFLQTEVLEKKVLEISRFFRKAEPSVMAKIPHTSDLVYSFFTYSMATFACIVFFFFLQKQFPMVYSNNILRGTAPPLEAKGFFGWTRLSRKATTEMIIQSSGLDMAMLIEFTKLGMRITALLSVPAICILSPIHTLFGTGRLQDPISRVSMENIPHGSNLYLFHAIYMWYVILVVQCCVWRAQANFIPLRMQWLQSMQEPRATTVLVEGIPEEFRSDARLHKFFSDMFGANKIKAACVVKRAPELLNLMNEKKEMAKNMSAGNRLERWVQDWRDQKRRSGGYAPDLEKGEEALVLQPTEGSTVDKEKIDQYNSKILDIKNRMKDERAKFDQEALTVGGVNSSNGFVTFYQRSDAELATVVQFSENEDEWVVSHPPEPFSVIWEDLKQDDVKKTVWELLGWLLTVLLFLFYLPLVVLISNLAKSIHLHNPVWKAYAPTIGMQIMVAMLPTLLITIHRYCFVLKDDAWAQLYLQKTYFGFQVIFVILLFAVLPSLTEFLQIMFLSPFDVFTILGERLPRSTHFYMNFMILQWFTHAINFTRHMQLAKFILFSRYFNAEEARALAEPEDQDYYGIGSRSARFTIALNIAIVFGCLSPPIAVVTFANFTVCRLIYGYMIPFAETKKPDLGGAFWVAQLRGIFVGTGIFTALMTGVIIGRSNAFSSCLIAFCSNLYVIWMERRFEVIFCWQKLPFKEVAKHQKSPKEVLKLVELDRAYIQPELLATQSGAMDREEE
mmetsp:Transcript_54023/g.94866  ORF Transcript_54023/g.94866 Transcript_54023/m.94866 type:complete len:804 (+) Transcript_54023:78-2489(+)